MSAFSSKRMRAWAQNLTKDDHDPDLTLAREQGAREERRRIARRMKEKHYPPEIIADLTGLTIAEIGAILL